MKVYKVGNAWYSRESIAMRAAKETARTLDKNKTLAVQTVTVKTPLVVAALNGEAPEIQPEQLEGSVIVQGLGLPPKKIHGPAPKKK